MEGDLRFVVVVVVVVDVFVVWTTYRGTRGAGAPLCAGRGSKKVTWQGPVPFRSAHAARGPQQEVDRVLSLTKSPA